MNDKVEKKDTVKQSAKDGTVTTDEGKKVEAVSPAIPHPAPEVGSEEEDVALLSVDEQEKFLGELKPGEAGYIPLNPDGTIAGPAKRGTPGEGELAARVMAVGTRRADVLVTPSGAPLTVRMQPDPMITPSAGRVGEERRKERNAEKG